jgi:hypothetical protein
MKISIAHLKKQHDEDAISPSTLYYVVKPVRLGRKGLSNIPDLHWALRMPSPTDVQNVPFLSEKNCSSTWHCAKYNARSFGQRLRNEVRSYAIDPINVDISRKSQMYGNGEEHAGGTGEARDTQLPFPIYGGLAMCFLCHTFSHNVVHVAR